MEFLNFIISDIFGNASIFLALIAAVGLIVQRKTIVEVLQGSAKTAIGVVVLTQGNGIIISAIHRDNEIIIPDGRTQIQDGDRVVILSLLSSIPSLEGLIRQTKPHLF